MMQTSTFCYGTPRLNEIQSCLEVLRRKASYQRARGIDLFGCVTRVSFQSPHLEALSHLRLDFILGQNWPFFARSFRHSAHPEKVPLTLLLLPF